VPSFTAADFIAAALAYLLGSLSFAVIVSKAMALPDPKSYGSGNPGATNVLRSGSKKAAVLTLLGDTLKGVLAVLLAKYFAVQYGISEAGIALVAVAVFLGHLFPVFFGFKGGKGVATAGGVLVALDWRLGAGLLAIWALIFAVKRVSSLAAVLGSLCAPALAFYFYDTRPVFWATLVMTALLIYRHKDNIRRMLAKQEDSFNKRRVG
jgi:acyl phosphate:glycerol-3-phosphate acyltransferase